MFHLLPNSLTSLQLLSVETQNALWGHSELGPMLRTAHFLQSGRSGQVQADQVFRTENFSFEDNTIM